MSDWKIRLPNGTRKTAEELGLSGLHFTQRSQASDTFAFTSDQRIESDLLWGYLDPIEIFLKDTCVFSGRMIDPRGTGTDADEGYSYSFSNAWWDLEHHVYEQQWYTGKFTPTPPTEGGESKDTVTPVREGITRLLLGYSIEGDRIYASAVIREILEFAISRCGVKITVGTISESLDVQLPGEEVEDLTCAEAINRVLRWFPSVQVYFDYKTEMPTIHFRKSSELETRSLKVGIDFFTIPSIAPRFDLQPKGVSITYTLDHSGTDASGNSNEWTETLKDKYPTNVSGYELGVSRFAVSLQGSSSTALVQKIKTKRIEHESDDWWKTKFSWIRDPRISNFKITKSGLTSEDEEATPFENELIEGGIAEWMSSGIKECDTSVWAEVSYDFATTGNQRYEAKPSNQRIDVKVRTVNVTTRTFVSTDTTLAAESPPVGLAKSFYEQTKDLRYEGSISLIAKEWDGTTWMAYRLNLLGAKKEWETMQAVIQGVDIDLDSGTVTLTMGPPKWLSPGDFIDFTRNNRNRRPAQHLRSQRKTGKSDKSKNVGLPDTNAKENSNNGPQPLAQQTIGNVTITDLIDSETGEIKDRFKPAFVVNNFTDKTYAIRPFDISKNMTIKTIRFVSGDKKVYEIDLVCSEPEFIEDFVCDCDCSDTPDPDDTTDVPTSFSILNQK